MESTNLFIPSRIVGLLIAFFSQTISKPESTELDEWICASDDNIRMFGDFVKINSAAPVPHPDLQEFEFEMVGAVHLN